MLPVLQFKVRCGWGSEFYFLGLVWLQSAKQKTRGFRLQRRRKTIRQREKIKQAYATAIAGYATSPLTLVARDGDLI
jgi:hypothetical protein